MKINAKMVKLEYRNFYNKLLYKWDKFISLLPNCKMCVYDNIKVTVVQLSTK